MKLIPSTDIWVPDSDLHFSQIIKKTGKPRAVGYQLDKLTQALSYVTRFRQAIDVGAHVGLMTRELAKRFDHVYAFEAHPENFACLTRNLAGCRNVTLINKAVGRDTADLYFNPAANDNTGDRRVSLDAREGWQRVEQTKLDALPLEHLDFIKMDIQGFEQFALEGGASLIRYCRPVIMFEREDEHQMAEAYGLNSNGASKWCKYAGAQLAERAGSEEIWQFPPANNPDFEKYAERGAYHWHKYETAKRALDEIDRVVAHIKSQGHASILDIGCGDGLWTYMLGAYGVDSSPDAIRLAQAHGVQCECLDAFSLEGWSRRFDAITLFDVLEHLYEQAKFVSILRQIAPTLYVLNPEPKGCPHHAREFTAEALKHWMESQGWLETHRMEVTTNENLQKHLHTFRRST